MIRVGLPNDFDQIERFDPFAGDRRAELAEGRVLVAEVAGHVAGYATFSNPGFIGHPFLHFVAVEPRHRRRGIACSLLQAIARDFVTKRLFASTEEDNTAMLALFDREGWSSAGSVRGVNADGSAECFFYRDIEGP